MTRRYDLLVFDLDGVITTEQIYWDCARLTLWEYMSELHLPIARRILPGDIAAVRALLPDEIIFAIKDRAVNSNWDLAFIATCALFAVLPVNVGYQLTAATLLDQLQKETQAGDISWPQPLNDLINRVEGETGAALIRSAGMIAAEMLNTVETLFTPHGAVWQHCYSRFQRWYSGEATAEHGIKPLEEKPAIALAQIQAALYQIHAAGYQLGIATGRPRDEALRPLGAFNVLEYFAPDRIATYSDVLLAQQESGAVSLGKPHPYTLHKVLSPGDKVYDLLHKSPQPNRALLIGDTVSDALAARAAGVDCIGVLSGVHSNAARTRRSHALRLAGCRDVLDNITALPLWLKEHWS